MDFERDWQMTDDVRLFVSAEQAVEARRIIERLEREIAQEERHLIEATPAALDRSNTSPSLALVIRRS